MRDHWKIILVFLMMSVNVEAQLTIENESELNRYDSLGNRNGDWIQFLDKKLKETNSEKKAVFKIYRRYHQGQEFPNGVFKYAWPAKYSIYIDENHIDSILSKRVDETIPFLNGDIFAMNKYGDTLFTQGYSQGRPVGRFVWREYATTVPFIVYDFGAKGDAAIELWERSALQESGGPFDDHGIIALTNDTVYYNPVIDESGDHVKNVQVFIYCNEKPGNVQDGLFTLNDYYVLALTGTPGYLNFNMNCSDFPTCEGIKVTRATVVNPLIERVVYNEDFPDKPVVLKFVFAKGRFVSVDLIEVTEGMNDLCIPIPKPSKWKRTPAERFEWYREKPNKRQFKKWKKDHFTQL